ncbi:hypothetical protein [Spirosoma gilvum]
MMVWSILLLSFFCRIPEAPPTIAGLGQYVLGMTTSDLPNKRDFQEVEPVLVKGTLALTCAQVRLFTAQSVEVNGLLVTKLSLVFYEGKLFQISCDANDELQKMFHLQYGQGVHTVAQHLNLCGTQTNKLLTLEGEIWQRGNVLARLVLARGYDSNCQMTVSRRLVITDQRVSALCSACDLSATDPFLEAFDRVNVGRR